MFGATKADSLKINAYANLNMLPGYVKRQQLMTMVPVSLCGSQVASAYNSNGACPSDGTYSFETMFQMDSPNDFSAWMKTGYRGEATVTMYLDTTMSVVGRCTFGIRTKPSVPIPSAMFVITMLVLSFSVYVGYVITRHLRPQWLPKYLQRNKNTEELLPYDHQFRNVLPPYKQKEQPQPLIEESRW